MSAVGLNKGEAPQWLIKASPLDHRLPAQPGCRRPGARSRPAANENSAAARVVDACRDSGESVIASADLLNRLALPADIKARSLGLIRLRGKEQAIGLCVLTHAVSK